MIDHQLAKSSIAIFEEMLKGKTSCSEQPYKHELLACLKTAKCFNSWGSSTCHREVPIADTKQETHTTTELDIIVGLITVGFVRTGSDLPSLPVMSLKMRK